VRNPCIVTVHVTVTVEQPEDGESLQEVHTRKCWWRGSGSWRQESDHNAARLAAGGFKASRVNVESRIRSPLMARIGRPWEGVLVVVVHLAYNEKEAA